MHIKNWTGLLVLLILVCALGTVCAEMNYELVNPHLSVQMGVPEEIIQNYPVLPDGNGQETVNPGQSGESSQEMYNPGLPGNDQGIVNPGLPGNDQGMVNPGLPGNDQGMVNPGLPGNDQGMVNPGIPPASNTLTMPELGDEVLPPELLAGGLSEAAGWVEPMPEENAWPRTFTVTVAGDTTLGSTDTLRKRPDCFENVAASNGYAWFFSGLTSLFGTDDLTLINFEGTLTEETTKKQKKFNFKGPAEYTEILTSGSIEAVNVANNHTLDYGEQGREDTIANLTAAGLIVSGNGQLGIFEKNGIRVGMTGYCFPYKDGKKDISTDVRKLREAGCQIVIASFHWGSEYKDDFTREQRDIGRAAIRAGADIVVGHHPHIVQGVEQYQGRYILYSLGNLVFGGNVDPDDRDSCAMRLTFTVYPDRSEPPVMSMVPLRLTSLAKGTDYRPVLAEGDDAERIVNRILKRSYEMDQFVNIPFMP